MTDHTPPGPDRKALKSDAAAAKARAKADRPIWRKKRFLVPVVLVVIVAIVAISSGDDETEPTDASDTEQNATDADEASDDTDQPADDAEESDDSDQVSDNNAVGDTVSMGDLDHVLHSARFSEGDDMLAPDEGERWLVVDIEITNNGDDSEAISSIMMWQLVDEENRSRDMQITTDQQGSLDGELGAGRSMRGEIAYSVDAGQEAWELIFEPSVFGFGQAVYDIDTADVD